MIWVDPYPFHPCFEPKKQNLPWIYSSGNFFAAFEQKYYSFDHFL